MSDTRDALEAPALGRRGARRVVAIDRRVGLMAWPARLAVVVGLANLVVLFLQAGAIVGALYRSSDSAAAFVLPTLAGRAGAGSVTVIGNHSWYEAWWFMRATVGLPGHLQIWEGAPFVVALAGIGAVCWCAWVAVGRLAAVTCGVVLLSMSVAMRGVLLVPGARVGLILHAGALLAALLWVDRNAAGGRLRRSPTIAVGVVLVAFTAAGATDQMLVLAGVVPYVFAPCVCWWCDRSRHARAVAGFALTSGLASLAGAAVLTGVMRSMRVIPSSFPIALASGTGFRLNLQYLLTGWTTLAGGAFGTRLSPAPLPAVAAASLALLALACVLGAVYRRGVGLTRRSLSPAGRVRTLYVSFWACGLGLMMAVFVVTTAGSQGEARYLLGPWVAVAALVGAFAKRRWLRDAILLGVAVFGLLALRADLVDGVRPYGVAPDKSTAQLIERFALAHGASVGYTGYWDALTVTLETRFKVTEVPIIGCSAPSGYCRFNNVEISSWYRPRAHVSTFLVTDSQMSATPVDVPSPDFGRPVASATFGDFTVLVYRHDLAADLGSPP